MPKRDENLTTADVYNLVQQSRLENKGDIKVVSESMLRLENKFDMLEAGKISRLEGIVADLGGKVAGYEGKQTGQNWIVPILVSVAVSVIGFIINFSIKK